jgi:hypothetical protein
LVASAVTAVGDNKKYLSGPVQFDVDVCITAPTCAKPDSYGSSHPVPIFTNKFLINYSGRLDDIQDGSTLRRGTPAAYVLFGEGLTINSANYRYVQVTKELEQLKGKSCRQLFLGTECHIRQYCNYLPINTYYPL